MQEHARLVIALLLGRAMCVGCLMVKSTLRCPAVAATLRTIEQVIVLHRASMRCEVCGVLETVLSVDGRRRRVLPS